MSGEIPPIERFMKLNEDPKIRVERTFNKEGKLQSYLVSMESLNDLLWIGLDNILIRHGMQVGDMFAYWSHNGRFTQC